MIAFSINTNIKLKLTYYYKILTFYCNLTYNLEYLSVAFGDAYKDLHQIYPYEVEVIFERVGIAKSLLDNQNVSIPVEKLLKFVIDAESVFEDELVSINFGRMAQVIPNYGEAFGLAFIYSKNLKEGITLLQSFIGTELEGINFLITDEDKLIKIQSVADPKIKHPSIYENLGLS